MSFELVESFIVFLVVILLFRWATFNLGFTNAHGIVLFYRVFPVIKVSIARPELKRSIKRSECLVKTHRNDCSMTKLEKHYTSSFSVTTPSKGPPRFDLYYLIFIIKRYISS